MIERRSDLPWLLTAADAKLVVDACAAARTSDALLHPANLPRGFFDLTTGVAGDCLQKWRNYRIRVAVVAPPGSVLLSSRFGEMLAEEAERGDFRLFESREPAEAWLSEIGDEAGGG